MMAEIMRVILGGCVNQMTEEGVRPPVHTRKFDPTLQVNAWVKQLASIRPQNLRLYYVPATKANWLLERVGEVFDAHDAGYAISYEPRHSAIPIPLQRLPGARPAADRLQRPCRHR